MDSLSITLHRSTAAARRLLAVGLTLLGAASAGASESATTSVAAPAAPAAGEIGILVVAHGANPAWNTPVKTAVEKVARTAPAEVAFLMGTPDQTPQQAYDKLVAAGARRVVIVPLFVSSHGSHVEQVRFLGGQRADYPHAEHMKLVQLKGEAPIVGVSRAMDDHAIVADILADRARALSQDPAAESLVIVAHGPNEDEAAARWTQAIRNVGARVRGKVPFKDVDVRLLRDDAAGAVKEKALAELRASVTGRAANGRVVVVPLFMSAGRAAGQIPEVLKGLSFAWDGKTLLPDDRIADWILDEAGRTAGRSLTAETSDASLGYNEQVVVSATRTERPLADVPVQTEVIDRAAIVESGARTLADVLPYRMGLDVVPSLAGQGLQLQGIGERGILLLVDGQPVIGKISGGVDVGNLLLDDVERIEVVKGASSTVYGSEALGGVINILTRTPNDPLALSLEQRFESLDGRTTQASAGVRTDRWNGFFSASRITRDAYDLTPADISTTGSALEKVGVSGKAGVRLGPSTSLQATTRYYGDDAKDVTVSSRGVIQDDLVEDTRYQTILDFRTKPDVNGALNVRGHISRYEHSFDRTIRSTGVLTPDLTNERMADVEAQYDRAFGTQHLVTVGAEGGRIGMTSDRITGGSRNANTGVGYVQDQWFVTPRLHVVTGLRYDTNTEFGSAWSPKVALLFRGTDALRVRASYGEGFKAPEFKDLYYLFGNRAAGYQVIGNPDLRAEDSRSINAGVDVDLLDRGRMRVSVTGFQHRINDLIDNVFIGVDPTSGIATYQSTNIGSVRTRGMESEVTASPVSPVSMALGYSFLDAEDRQTGQPLTLRARHTIKGRIVARLDRYGLTAALFGRRLGSRPFADRNADGVIEDFAPSLAIFDARIAWDAHRLVQLFVGAENLGDEQDVRYFPTSGRRVYGGFTVRYNR